ncbi:hypothetical protein DSL72_002936 [Monilinia vaccinii-corymbosi]|uniref:Glucose-methanol-choline oxidoreductase N-terminal domain-containing protein n=1 Tax=Monilinia vaccinii-corymbosi TaxID=61207 RepID=A0A8A3PDZ5_9HELO|nr:hypothetical protein DSL72_002936 [Monilinia vaccinii-corymbosi]
MGVEFRPTRFAGRTLDLTLFAFTRALDCMIGELWATYKIRRRNSGRWSRLDNSISSLSDPALFASSCALIMWAFIYMPARLPSAYNKWIKSAAQVDSRLLKALRYCRYGELKYGVDTGQASLLGDMCKDYGLPYEYGDPTQSIPFPCELVHMGSGPNCEFHALSRFYKSFFWSASMYLPLNLALFLRNPKSSKHTLIHSLQSSARSSAFLSTFVTLFYYGICLTRTRIGPHLFGTSAHACQAIDSGYAIGAGCWICGWSVLMERPKRRTEMGLFVAPRALAILLPRRYRWEDQWVEKAVFAAATAVVFTFTTYIDKDHKHEEPLICRFLVLATLTYAALGVPWNRDVNDGGMVGYNRYPSTYDRDLNIRYDAGRAYYYPVADRKNLHIYANTTAQRLTWRRDTDTPTAEGVEVLTNGSNDSYVISANREVIISAGSLASPAILELSGVGNPSILNKYDIDVVVDLPTVGENLQDQTHNGLGFQNTGLTNFTGGAGFVGYPTAADVFGSEFQNISAKVLESLPEYAAKVSAASGNVTKAADLLKFFKLQYELIFSSTHPVPVAEILIAPSAHSFTSEYWALLPFSRGNVHITSSVPGTRVAINPNYFHLDSDASSQIATAKFIRSLYSTAPLSTLAGSETRPGLSTVAEDAAEAEWFEWVKANYRSNFHPVATAAMLPRESGGVVDSKLKVYGAANEDEDGEEEDEEEAIGSVDEDMEEGLIISSDDEDVEEGQIISSDDEDLSTESPGDIRKVNDLEVGVDGRMLGADPKERAPESNSTEPDKNQKPALRHTGSVPATVLGVAAKSSNSRSGIEQPSKLQLVTHK